MNDIPTTDVLPKDPAQFAHNMAKVFEGAAKLATMFAGQSANFEKERERQVLPLEQVTKTLSEIARAYASDPQKLMEAQTRLWADYGQIWQNAWRRALGEKADAMAAPEKGDKRFLDRDWQENPFFDFMKQFYLVSARWAQDMVKNAEGVDDHTRLKARFYVEQIANALAPTNFVFTNPEVLRTTLATNGENLVEGLRNLENDLAAGDGKLQIKQTDLSAFEVGKSLAATPGKVVFRNETFELIQYSPSTKEVFEIPLLIIPPWINKFYILDLSPKKSFVRWAVAQGLTVFVVSWVNPDEAHGHKSFSDYMTDGFLAAVDAVQKATSAEKMNVIGYCVGGTMVASALGYMAARNDDRVNAATFFTTQVDFEKAGDLLVYVDDEQVRWIEDRMAEKGYLPGRRMADAFNLLRSNDLIWSYIVNNYMLGKEPMPFDLLYWNADTTRMPAGVHSFYLRECYLHNRLAKGQIALDNVRIDLARVKTPIYNLAARDDHIAPLPSVFKLGQYFGGRTRLVVAGSGHIAGVVNPPEVKKYQYWTNETGAPTLDAWLKGATEHPGSWWTDWIGWIGPLSGQKIPAGEIREPLGEAPGDYVRVRAD
jgi:polyhydroxyalkanoate synthase subunit PhaC